MKHCPVDGFPYEDEDNYCPVHGKELLSPQAGDRCKGCGRVRVLEIFCRVCGEGPRQPA